MTLGFDSRSHQADSGFCRLSRVWGFWLDGLGFQSLSLIRVQDLGFQGFVFLALCGLRVRAKGDGRGLVKQASLTHFL